MRSAHYTIVVEMYPGLDLGQTRSQWSAEVEFVLVDLVQFFVIRPQLPFVRRGFPWSVESIVIFQTNQHIIYRLYMRLLANFAFVDPGYFLVRCWLIV